MYFIKETIKKHKGISLLETILSLSIVAIIMVLIAVTMSFWVGRYKRHYDNVEKSTSLYEALMYIDYYYDKTENHKIVGNKLYMTTDDGDEDYISKWNTQLKVYYEVHNNANVRYIPQPLLKGVKTFTVDKNKNVIRVKIEMEDGKSAEKTYTDY